MGTSSSYGGPSGRTPLLPPWAENPLDGAAPGEGAPPLPPEDEGQGEVAPTPVVPELTWRAPKRVLSRLARGAGGGPPSGGLRALGRSYVRASGGARTAAAAARAGRATTGRLGGFLAAGIRDGFRPTVERLGLRGLLGQDVQTVLAAFVDLLAPEGALLEAAAARTALIETLEAVFERYDVGADGVEALDRMDAVALGEVVELSVVNYVNARMQQELANRIERGTLPEAEANRLMAEIRDFIGEIVKLDFAGVDLVQLEWDGPDGRRLVAGVYEEAYQLLGEEE